MRPHGLSPVIAGLPDGTHDASPFLVELVAEAHGSPPGPDAPPTVQTVGGPSALGRRRGRHLAAERRTGC
jgi:hypothetical protein